MRILLFTGKGGVGKTTCAAATALAAARAGRRVAVMSTDPAHSLADAFAVPLGDDFTEVAPRCEARQLDTRRRMEATWGELRDYLRELFMSAGLDEVEAEELAVLPGLDEVFALGDVKDVAADGRYDVLVVDCAPTAETVRLLSLPEVMAVYMDRLFPVGRRLNRMVGPVVARLAHVPAVGDEVFGATQRLFDRLRGVRELLSGPEASVRLVVNAEQLVVEEARRTYTYLSLFGYPVDAVVVNRLLPTAVEDPWFDRWREVQGGHLHAVEEGFHPLPVLTAELADDEIVGHAALERFARHLYGATDPVAVLHRHEPVRVEVRDGRPHLLVSLPFAGRDELDLGRSGTDLVVTVGPHRRVIALPDTLVHRQVDGARLSEGVLAVSFTEDGEMAAP